MPLLLSCALVLFPAPSLGGPGQAAWTGHVVGAAGDVDGDGVGDWIVGLDEARKIQVVSGRGASVILATSPPIGTGWIADRACSLGDIDGDSRSDLLLSSERLCDGKVRAIRGKDGTTAFEIRGSCATVLGDLNSDRVQDFVVAVPEDIEIAWRGPARLALHSGVDGSPLSTGPDRKFEKVGYGFALASVGDIDGDGLADFGAIVDGRALVLSGKSCETLRAFDPRQGRKPVAITGGADLDGDKRSDLLVGYPNEKDEDTGKGVVAGYSGVDGREIGLVEGTGGNFGFALSILGDADGDAVPDFAVGCHGEGFVDPVRMISGRTWKELWAINADFEGNCHRMPALAAVPDADGDGVADLLVGAPGMGGRCNQPGYVMLVSGKSGKSVQRIAPPAAKQEPAAEKPR